MINCVYCNRLIDAQVVLNDDKMFFIIASPFRESVIYM